MAALQILLGLAYPILIYFALGRFEPRVVAAGLLVLLALRISITARARLASYTRVFWLPVASVGLVAGVTGALNHPLGLLAAPVLVSGALLAVFALSLWQPQCIVERFARLQATSFSEEEIRYCRRVTVMWCGFFLANGAVALGLALARNLEAWTLYTGLISYVLIGLVFGSEFIYRQWRFRRYVGLPTDAFFRRIFPPPDPEASSTGALRADTSAESPLAR
jgi:uncharacterized membrane protein